MQSLYQSDLAYVHSIAFETLPRGAAGEIVRTLRNSGVEVFRRVGDAYRRSHEVHRVRLFDVSILRNQLASNGFVTEMLQSYGVQPLPPRRHAFFATRLAAADSKARRRDVRRGSKCVAGNKCRSFGNCWPQSPGSPVVSVR